MECGSLLPLSHRKGGPKASASSRTPKVRRPDFAEPVCNTGVNRTQQTCNDQVCLAVGVASRDFFESVSVNPELWSFSISDPMYSLFTNKSAEKKGRHGERVVTERANRATRHAGMKTLDVPPPVESAPLMLLWPVALPTISMELPVPVLVMLLLPLPLRTMRS